MADHARSDDAAVQAQLDRFAQLSPGRDILGLERIEALMALLGNPHRALPPTFHVAGTNGKGSTCAFLRAAVEAAGLTTHVYSSPHLVRFNERIRVAGKLIEDSALAPLLAEVLDVSEAHEMAPSFFEATTAAAFLAFARTPADALILEVGLGGRLDATNIIEHPLVCGIASLGIDHEAFLLAPEAGVPEAPLDRIAFEKSGIAKSGIPLISQAYTPSMMQTIATVAAQAKAEYLPRKTAWDAVIYEDRLHYRDEAGKLNLPLPRMTGAHQADNAALAVAMLRHQTVLDVPESALAAAMEWAHWPARMQKLGKGPLTDLLPEGSIIWLDGGHNPDGGAAIARTLEDGPPVHIIAGMLKNKDALGFLRPFAHKIASLHAVPVPGHEHHDPKDLCWWAQDGLGITLADPVDNVQVALKRLAVSGQPSNVLICGTLYLAGQVLLMNNQVPD
jgi:dihydrofolate synthase / folylpolyglutamate synthase